LSRARRLPLRLCAALVALAAGLAGCDDPFRNIEAATVRGYLAEDLLPADREVGSWRRAGKEGEARPLAGRDFQETFGEEAASRAKPWGTPSGAAATYRLGETGRTVTVAVYDLAQAKGAFDVYALVRERALTGENPPLVTKAGVQGLLYSWSERKSRTDRRLLFWAERFMVQLTAVNGGADQAEAALLAFAAAVSAKMKQPFELPEVYVLQIPGEAANSERYEPGRPWRRPELSGAVTAKWTGRTGTGTLFISVAKTSGEAAGRFERLRRAAEGHLTPNFALGLFSGDLAGAGPVLCFLHGKAVAGLVGAAELEERMAAVEEIRRRCAGEAAKSPAAPESAP
jgi:hypothetical protein